VNFLSKLINKNFLKKSKFLVLDVDGCLTDGGLYYQNNDYVIKRFNVKDGLGIKLLQNIGIEVAFISGGRGDSTIDRAKDLGINNCIINCKNKFEALKNLQNKLKFSIEETIYLGDDLNDLQVIPLVKIFAAPSDAVKEVLKKADLKLKSCGGAGAVRELSNEILKHKNNEVDIKIYDFISKNV
tara:strand:- start:90 stop:641 length:552 start_codon:yes stop_codon:yes gene_type:complete